MQKLIDRKYVSTTGRGKGTKYFLSLAFELIYEIEPNDYFLKEIDERVIKKNFNHTLIKDSLNKVDLFDEEEQIRLHELKIKYRKKISELSAIEYQKELQRLAIDLSWKSSQIEGNTYSLLETEILLLEKLTAAGRTKDEAIMLLNHKDAIDFLIEDPNYVKPLTLRRIEDIHRLLTKELGVDQNIRKRSVGILGTNYKPLDNDFQIREAMEELCGLINLKKDVFEKALLALILISYIQPFVDGNKRTARIISNAILMSDDCCPISYRTASAIEYKMAMLIFYEQNNVSVIKQLFIEQFEFAVNTYF